MPMAAHSSDQDEPLPGERPKNCVYIPPSSTRRTAPIQARPRSSKFKQKQCQFPVLRPDSDIKDTFQGSQRAFLAGHRRKAALAARLAAASWRVNEKEHACAYRREMDVLTMNIRIRDERTLGRSSEKFAPMTKGPRPRNKLPREVQDTTYPRAHLRYFGA
jgi:hypothetical protein